MNVGMAGVRVMLDAREPPRTRASNQIVFQISTRGLLWLNACWRFVAQWGDCMRAVRGRGAVRWEECGTILAVVFPTFVDCRHVVLVDAATLFREQD